MNCRWIPRDVWMRWMRQMNHTGLEDAKVRECVDILICIIRKSYAILDAVKAVWKHH
jgi:hypothetical protein